MRITQGMMSSKYLSSLNKVETSLQYYSNRATTYRNFDKVSEDPVAASQSYKLNYQYDENANYQTNSKDASNALSTAETILTSINTGIEEVSTGDVLQAVNGSTAADDRHTIATKLRTVQGTILTTINSKYGDKFIFGGSNTTEPPFTVASNGALLYRGADVTTGKLVNEDGAITYSGDYKISFGKDNGSNFNGYTVNIINDTSGSAPVAIGHALIDTSATAKTITVNVANTATGTDIQNILKNPTLTTITPAGSLTVDLDKITVSGNDLSKPVTLGKTAPITDTVDLSALANEKVFTDLGFGLKFNSDGTLNEQTAYNSSINGIAYLGYGQTSGGVSNNIYTLLGQIADKLESSGYNYDDTKPYIDNLNKLQSGLLTGITEIGVKSTYLERTQSSLEVMSDNLTSKISDVEDLDVYTAIMQYTQQKYCYNAALQIGNQILQSSFLDYMK